MHHVMFDIDGTLVQSNDFDAECYVDSVKEIMGIVPDDDWSNYQHVTDSGILNEIIEKAGFGDNAKIISQQVKQRFIIKISQRIEASHVNEVPGASAFIEYLNSRNDVILSIATGGWYESATLKLKAAGIEYGNIPIASSNNHYVRTEIMKIAENMAMKGLIDSNSYFGDAAWDQKASEELNYNFILVGDSVFHEKKIGDFNSTNEALSFIGL